MMNRKVERKRKIACLVERKRKRNKSIRKKIEWGPPNLSQERK